jgi:heptosyltransferase-2
MKKILVIQNKRIGDVLIASLIATNIKTVIPESEIHYFVYNYTSGVIENHPYIDKIIRVNEKQLKKIPNLIKTTWKLSREKYDIIFDPYAKFQSRVICLFSGAKIRVGFKKRLKDPVLPFYTQNVNFLKEKTHICGKSIQDRVHLVNSAFPIKNPNYEPKIYLSENEKKDLKLKAYNKPVIMIGVLGSTPQKSMPSTYIIEIIDHLTSNYDINILFNYAPHQKDEAQKIYESCIHKDAIIFDIYEDSIRGFIAIMNECKLLVSNEGGAVHIAKALEKPTFTIFSPYVLKSSWASFEDGIFHTSVHLLDEKPELFSTNKSNLKKIEENPQYLYHQLNPELILNKLNPFLKHHLSYEKTNLS